MPPIQTLAMLLLSAAVALLYLETLRLSKKVKELERDAFTSFEANALSRNMRSSMLKQQSHLETIYNKLNTIESEVVKRNAENQET